MKRAEAADLPQHVLATVAPLFESLNALARKLAGILFAMWREGTEFDPETLRHGVTKTVAAA